MQQNIYELGNVRIFLQMPDEFWIELEVVDKLQIYDNLSIVGQKDQITKQVLKIFKEDQLLKSILTIEPVSQNDGQDFNAQVMKKLQPIIYKITNSEPEGINVNLENQRISDVVEILRSRFGFAESKKIQARWNDQILDQNRFFYDYRSIQNQINFVQAQIPPRIRQFGENQQIQLKIQHQDNIYLMKFNLDLTVQEVCCNIQEIFNLSEMINLYQNSRKLDQASKLSDFLNISQHQLMAQTQWKSFSVYLNYYDANLEYRVYSQEFIQDIQEDIRQDLNIPYNTSFSLYINNIKLDKQLTLNEYFVKENQNIRIEIEPSRYIIMIPEYFKEVIIEIEDLNVKIDDIVLFIKQQFKQLNTNFCAYQGKNRLNMKININQVQIKSNIITLWQDLQTENQQVNEVLIFLNLVDLGKIDSISISLNIKTKELESITKEKFKINGNLLFYHNKMQICSNQSIKELGIIGQIQLECLIMKQSYNIQVRHLGVIKKFNVTNNTSVSKIRDRSRLEFEINENDYELDRYLIDQIIDITPFAFQLNIAVQVDDRTTRLNLTMNYQNKVQDLHKKLNRIYPGVKLNVYCDRLKQKKKRFLRELDQNNLVACQKKGIVNFDIQVKDQQIVLGQMVNQKQIIGDFLMKLFKNITIQNLKEFQLIFSNVILDQRQKFSQYLIQDKDIIVIQPPNMIYEFKIDGSQIDCQLIQFQKKLTFRIKFLNAIYLNNCLSIKNII